MFSSTRKVLSAIINPINTAVKIYHASIRYVASLGASEVIIYGLAMQVYLLQGQQKCPSVLPVFNYPTTGTLANSYASNFDMYANVAQLSQAEYFLIGVTDVRGTIQYELPNQLINYLGDTTEHVYFSGVVGRFDCKTYCLANNRKALITENEDECLPLEKLADKFICQGWESASLVPTVLANKLLSDTYKVEEDKFLALKAHNDNYLQLKRNITEVKVQMKVLDQSRTSVFGISNDMTEHNQWLQDAGKLLDTIEAIYRDCIPESYAQQYPQIEQIRMNISIHTSIQDSTAQVTKVMLGFNELIPQVEGEMVALFESFREQILHYQKHYDKSLTIEKRNQQGLIKQIGQSKSEPGKKFFVSPTNHYLNPTSAAASSFFPCNMSQLRDGIYDSVKDSKFAVMIYKPR